MGLEPEAAEVVTLDTPIVDIGVFNDPANHDQQEDELLEIVELLEEPTRTVATLEPTSVTDAPVTWRVIETIQHSPKPSPKPCEANQKPSWPPCSSAGTGISARSKRSAKST